jgi:hypothetical protein
VLNHAEVVVPDRRGDVSVLWGDVVISRRDGVSAYCGGSGLQVRDTCLRTPP